MTSGLRVHDLQLCIFIVSVVLTRIRTNSLLCIRRAPHLRVPWYVLLKVLYILMEREPLCEFIDYCFCPYFAASWIQVQLGLKLLSNKVKACMCQIQLR